MCDIAMLPASGCAAKPHAVLRARDCMGFRLASLVLWVCNECHAV
jgi:hypothetical protein